MNNTGAENVSNSDGYKPGAVPAALKVIRGFKQDQRTEAVKMSGNQVELIKFGEKKFVGVPVTSSYLDVKGIGEASRTFMGRKHEITSQVSEAEYVCLHFSNDVLFTYIYCKEVSDLNSIPEGMIGFTVPGSRYAKARSKEKDPYGLIHTYLQENGIERNPSLFALEVFRFGEEESKYNADIFVPVMD